MSEQNQSVQVDPEALKKAEAEAKAKVKAEKAAAAAAEKEARAKKKADEKAAKEAKKKEEADKKAAEKAAKEAAKEAAKTQGKMPMQNDVRRPKPESTCGKCWAVYDDLSTKRGSPCAIADAKKILDGMGINEATIRTQYAHWRKFNGVSGRVEAVAAPVPPAPPAPPVAPAPAPAPEESQG